jgi:hypothetical protein
MMEGMVDTTWLATCGVKYEKQAGNTHLSTRETLASKASEQPAKDSRQAYVQPAMITA